MCFKASTRSPLCLPWHKAPFPHEVSLLDYITLLQITPCGTSHYSTG